MNGWQIVHEPELLAPVQRARSPQSEYVYMLLGASLVYDDVLRAVVSMLQGEDFSSPTLRLIHGCIVDHVKEFNVAPKPAELGHELAKKLFESMGNDLADFPADMAAQMDEDIRLITEFSKKGEVTAAYITARMRDFVQTVRTAKILADAAQGGASYKAGEVIAKMAEVGNVGMVGSYSMSTSWGNPEPILTRQNVVRVPTAITRLDTGTAGGLRPGELGIVVAAPGVGKTTTLICATEGATLNNWLSLLITLELSGPRIKHRHQGISAHIDAKYYKLPQSEWPEDVLNRFRFFASTSNPYRDSVTVADMSRKKHTVEDIEGAIVQWRSHILSSLGAEAASKCISVYVDWLDMLTTAHLPRNKSEKDWDVLMDLMTNLGHVGRRQQVTIWTATQAGKTAVGKEVLSGADMAFSFHKLDAADVAIGLSPLIDLDNNSPDEDSDVTAEQYSERSLCMSWLKNRDNIAKPFHLYQASSLRLFSNKDAAGAHTKAITSTPLEQLFEMARKDVRRG